MIPISAIWCIPFANILLKIHYSFSIKKRGTLLKNGIFKLNLRNLVHSFCQHFTENLLFFSNEILAIIIISISPTFFHFSLIIKYWPLSYLFSGSGGSRRITLRWRNSSVSRQSEASGASDSVGSKGSLKDQLRSSAPGSSWVLAYLKCPERLSCNVIFSLKNAWEWFLKKWLRPLPNRKINLMP